MEGKSLLSRKVLFVASIGVALMLLLLFLLKPYVVAIADVESPRCAAFISRDNTQLVALLRGISFKEGWLYLIVYSSSKDIPRLLNKVENTIKPECVVIGIDKNTDSFLHLQRNKAKLFVLPDDKEKLLRYIYRKGE